VSILTLDILKKQWPHGDQHVPGLIEGIVDASDRVFMKYDMNTPLLISHFMAQASEECGQGLEMWENMHYTVAGLRKTFPTHFTPSMARRAAGNEKLTADIAYGGRMGNAPPPSDDGYNFRGHGLTNCTGRDGAEALQKFLTAHGVVDDRDPDHVKPLDIVNDFDLVCDPHFALECGVGDWIVCGCLPHAKADDIVRETRALNGGYNGLKERRRQLMLWKRALGVNQ
jgi:putative chitinase